MKLIKLSAIDSTNDFLKELSKNELLPNFTTVIAEEQTKGRGQMGASWLTEKGKNLIMSILIKDFVGNPDQVFHLNVAVSVSVLQVLKELELPDLSIKWPNDILSHDKKIAGILIENRFRSDGSIESIVGVGLNVNQTDFSTLPNASSLALIAGHNFDIQSILGKITSKMKENCGQAQDPAAKLWQFYSDTLFKKDQVMPFEDKNNERFYATILGVTQQGKLELMHEDKSIREFAIKEITMIY